jgi:hypothetical protein
MKAILEFNLPEDKENFDLANNALNYYSALFEFDQWLRSEYKYNNKEEMYEVRRKLNKIINENNITI